MFSHATSGFVQRTPCQHLVFTPSTIILNCSDDVVVVEVLLYVMVAIIAAVAVIVVEGGVIVARP